MFAKIKEWLLRDFPDRNRYDEFITIRANGTAHFDISAYLATEEGRERICRLADRVTTEVDERL